MTPFRCLSAYFGAIAGLLVAGKLIVASFGTINVPGFDPSDANVMNGPYSAYVIGDYTGITPPF